MCMRFFSAFSLSLLLPLSSSLLVPEESDTRIAILWAAADAAVGHGRGGVAAQYRFWWCIHCVGAVRESWHLPPPPGPRRAHLLSQACFMLYATQLRLRLQLSDSGFSFGFSFRFVESVWAELD